MKGFDKKKGVDFEEICFPVVKISYIQDVLGLVTNLDLEVKQLDIKTAFIHSNLNEEIYIEQPEGFSIRGKEELVCKLKKSLYGLKQAPRQCRRCLILLWRIMPSTRLYVIIVFL